MHNVSFCVAILFAIVLVGNSAIPDYISVCKHDEPNLAKCIQDSIEKLKPRLISGIPELQVPTLEPFHVDNVTIDSVAGPNHLGTNLTNVRAHGASKFEIIKIVPKATKNGYSFGFEVMVPHIYVEGNYKMETKILFLELNGDGPFNANISDYHFSCNMKGRKVEREGNNYLNFDKIECNLEVGKIKIYLGNLFNGNELLGNATNAIINDNADTFFQEIKPNILKAISNLFTDIANKITLAFRYEELFP